MPEDMSFGLIPQVLDKIKLIEELEFLRRHYDRLAELMGVNDPHPQNIYQHEHMGKVKFIDYLILRIRDEDFDM